MCGEWWSMLTSRGGAGFAVERHRLVTYTTVNDQTTVWFQGVMIAIQADQPLRDRIPATLHIAQVDENDCPTSDRISADPTLRVDGLDLVEDVRSRVMATVLGVN
jgi:hypothetical protein